MDTRGTPLEPEKYYHIYNRGVNGQNIFFEQRNYDFFLRKYAQYVYPFVETFAYCLLKNHFHFLIKGNCLAPMMQWAIEKPFLLPISNPQRGKEERNYPVRG